MKQHFLRVLAVQVASGLLVAAAAGARACADPGLPELRITGGRISGAVDGPVASFKGIPYAAPPIGKLRWKPPAPVIPWKGVRDATKFGPASLQPDPSLPQSEDCLTLNVWTPYPKPAKPIPVLFFVHGGRGVTGSGRQFDGTSLAKQGAVVVTLNYRLGALGFLAHASLGQLGNFGLQDLQEGLRWVHVNAAAFGGDPGRIMAFGQSAGADFVAALLTMPKARGLISSAILQSGSGNFWSEAASLSLGTAMARHLGCDDAACLRSLAAERILKVSEGTAMFPPTIDRKILPASPFELISKGRWSKVPLIAGSNKGDPDARFHCFARRILRAAWHGKGKGGWRYVYTAGDAGHSTEIPLLFGSPGKLAEALLGSWVEFARTGEAVKFLGVTWPDYDPRDEKHLELSATPTPGQAYQTTACDSQLREGDGP